MTDDEAAPQDTAAIIKAIVKQRASQRVVLLGRRILTVKVIKSDFRLNRHEVEINPTFVLSGDPISAVDKILNAVVDFDEKAQQEKAQRLVEVKSHVLQWSAYLQRSLTKREYMAFVIELMPTPNGDGPHEEAEAEGERFIDRGIPFAP